ncbi:hypothetical protein TWF191_001339 [Orbilia oligospora]|uniref:Uncharacterized protein n=1 Tax=Orbilia oligospora TaxID=2813651 RepID=A0A7C8UB53_ORBOL|nr:hypothetical protein TWF191_001339 [Orbilia oligospora]
MKAKSEKSRLGVISPGQWGSGVGMPERTLMAKQCSLTVKWRGAVPSVIPYDAESCISAD